MSAPHTYVTDRLCFVISGHAARLAKSYTDRIFANRMLGCTEATIQAFALGWYLRAMSG
jgi:hypothetical protein